MTSKATTIQQYLEELPPDRQTALSTLRTLIHQIAPEATEKMAYGLPAFGDLCSFASQKHYMALYICDVGILDSHRSQLGKLDCGKCCIRFKRIEDLPMDVIEQILRKTSDRHSRGIRPNP